MAQLSVSQSAELGSSLTGLPVAFVTALINAEGTFTNGHNNPFDVTSTYASFTPYKAIPGADWGTQGNIASFSDTEQGVRAWADGILNQPVYSNFRYIQSIAGNDAYQLALALSQAGYAGNPTGNSQNPNPGWVSNVVSLYNTAVGQGISTAGLMTASTIQQASTGTPSGGIEVGNPLQAVTNAATGLTDPIANALNTIANNVGTGVNSITGSLAQLTAVGQFLGQPHFVERLLLLLGGGALLLIGLVLFALSFVKPPAGGAVPVPIPV